MDLDKHNEMANAIRMLAVDAVEAAKSGHPGLPMGAADIATVLFSRHAVFDPKGPDWPDRDRFVLSAGHGSMLLYAVLYLLGYEDMTIEEIRRFRQLGSRAEGHPEYGKARGIETTTGPLGQGLANAVGMALAERMMNAAFGDDLVDHRTYVLASDGDLMEGISHEAISIAGHLRLARLVVIYDDNGITIDGRADLAESGDVVERFRAAGWNALRIDGHDPAAIDDALATARSGDRPTLIAARTVIGFGSPGKAGSEKVHGAPLGEKEVLAVRKQLSWESAPFEVPSDVRDAWRLAGLRSGQARKDWQRRYEAAPADLRAEFDRRLRRELPLSFAGAMANLRASLHEERPALATRKASERALGTVVPALPELVGGSADLSGSNNTRVDGMAVVTAGAYSGRYVHWGVREHGMAAAMNGMALAGGLIPYGGTFLVFSDYARPAMRLAALMSLGVVYVMTHDSIGLGEDGATHQPVEHLAALRAMPGLVLIRPADAIETADAWEIAAERRDGPTVLALTRQTVECVTASDAVENRVRRGAYELAGPASEATVSLFASGSEVQVALKAREMLAAEGVVSRVVSVPSFELFEAQDADYRAAVIGDAPVNVAVEAAVRQGWDRFIGTDGVFVGMDRFGASAPAADLFRHFGITAEAVVDATVTALAARGMTGARPRSARA